MGNSPLVTIITVHFRNEAVTSALLDSIRRNSFQNVEVIVVDNGSEKDVSGQFQRHFPAVKVIHSKKNRGFAGGNNLGIAAATGDFLFFVNNDTELTDGLIEALLQRFDTPGVGAVSPKIRYYDRPHVIQYAGFTKVHPFTARNRTIGQGEADLGQHDEPKETPYAHGAAMMVSREVIDKVGKMPEVYFLYYEELDWCEMIRKAGFRIYYEPGGLIYHKESVPVGPSGPSKTYYLTRNRIIFM